MRGESSVVLDTVLGALDALGIARAEVERRAAERGVPGVPGILDAAAELTGNPTLGLDLAERTPIHARTPLIYLMMSSATLGGAIEHMVRYAPVLYRRPTRMWLEPDPRGAAISYGSSTRQYGEYTALLLVRMFRQIVGDPRLVPAEVRFAHAAPADARRHRELFGAPVGWDAPRHTLVIARAQLDLPSTHASPALHDLHERVVAEELPSPLAGDTLVERLRRALEERLESGPPPLAELARALGTSTRTLQRRLAELGVDYQQVVDEVRCARTLELLQKPSLSVLAVARAVGYADANSFHRAFRRWTGTTPGDYREASARGSDRWTSTPAEAPPGAAGATRAKNGNGTRGRSNQKGRPAPKSSS
jgi:AraC-like DNA-binding protein